jgi:hypothetical protein
VSTAWQEIRVRYGPNEQTVHSSLNLPPASRLLGMTSRRVALPLNSIAGGGTACLPPIHHFMCAARPMNTSMAKLKNHRIAGVIMTMKNNFGNSVRLKAGQPPPREPKEERVAMHVG